MFSAKTTISTLARSFTLGLLVCVTAATFASPTQAQDLPQCPTDYSYRSTVATALDIPENADFRVTCTAGFFPDPAWAFAIDVADSDSATQFAQLALLTPTTELRVLAQSEQMPRIDNRRRRQRVVLSDMNADGIDELFWSGAGCHEGRCHNWLRVMVRSGRSLEEAGHFITENIAGEGTGQSADATLCRAVFGLVSEADGSRLLVADGQESLPDETGEMPTPDCLIGPHGWRLQDTTFEEQPVDADTVGVMTWLVERLLNVSRGSPETVRLPWSTNTPTSTGRIALTLEVSETTLLTPFVWLVDENELVAENPFWGVGEILPNRSGDETYYDTEVSFAVRGTRSIRDRDRLVPVLLLPSELACQQVEPLLDPRLWLVITDSLPMTDDDFLSDAQERVEELVAGGFTDAESFDSRRASLLSCGYQTVVAGRFGGREEATALVSQLEAAGFDAYAKAGWMFTFTDHPRWVPPSRCAETAPPEGQQFADITEISTHLETLADSGTETLVTTAHDATCRELITEVFSDGRPVGATALRESTRILAGVETLTELSIDVLDHTPTIEHVGAYQIAQTPVCAASLAFEVEQSLPPNEYSDNRTIRWHTRWLLIVPWMADDPATLAFEEVSWIIWESDVATDYGDEFEVVCESGRWLESFDDAFLTATPTRSQFYLWSIDEGYANASYFSNLEEAVTVGCGTRMYDYAYDFNKEDSTRFMLFDDRGRFVAHYEVCEEYQEGGAQSECEVTFGVAHDFGPPGASLFIDRTVEGGAEWYYETDRDMLLWAFEADGTLVRAFEGVLVRESRDSYDDEYHLETWTYEFQPSSAAQPDTIILTNGEDDDVTEQYEADHQGVFRLVEPSAP